MANDPRFEIYPRQESRIGDGPIETQYGWRFRAANGQITAIGGEGFLRREDAERAIFDFTEALTADGLSKPILRVDE